VPLALRQRTRSSIVSSCSFHSRCKAVFTLSATQIDEQAETKWFCGLGDRQISLLWSHLKGILNLLENRQHAGRALAFEEDKTMRHIPSARGNRYKLPGCGVPIMLPKFLSLSAVSLFGHCKNQPFQTKPKSLCN
jgi:hypothetical protein